MDKKILNYMSDALAKAHEELEKANYLAESGSNAGIRKMNSNKGDWLRWVIHLAEHGFEAFEEEERLASEQELVEEEDIELICDQCPVSTETGRLIAIKDDIIQSLRVENEDLKEKFDASQLKYMYEVEYRKALISRAMIDYATRVSKAAHDNCWLDGTFLVTPVEHLDKELLELIKE